MKTCISKFHTADVKADPGDPGQLLRLEDAAGPVFGRDHLVASLPVEGQGGVHEALDPAHQADALSHPVVLD